MSGNVKVMVQQGQGNEHNAENIYSALQGYYHRHCYPQQAQVGKRRQVSGFDGQPLDILMSIVSAARISMAKYYCWSKWSITLIPKYKVILEFNCAETDFNWRGGGMCGMEAGEWSAERMVVEGSVGSGIGMDENRKQD